MREIKFRAWHKDIKEMFEVGQITLEKGIWDYQPENRKHTGISIPYQPSFILMQYTGLHDKNGKEIYEGDILKIIDEGINYYVVKWDKDEASFKLVHKGEIIYTFCEISSSEDTEVIGNIYENKDLLEEREEK